MKGRARKSLSLTFIGVPKTQVEDEEVERIRKRKMVEKEQPKEIVPTLEGEVRFENEERGDFEDYTEKLVLFPTTIEETTTPPVRTENRGK